MSVPAAERRLAIVLLCCLILVWGLFWPAMKVALAEIPVLTFRAACAVVGAAGLFALSAGRRNRLSVAAADRRMLSLAAFLNIFAWFALTGFAVQNLPAGRAVLLAYTMPLWSFLLAMLVLGERPSWIRAVGLLTGLGGIAVLAEHDLRRLDDSATLGVLAMLLGAFLHAGGMILQKRTAWSTPLLTQSAWQLTIGGLPLLVLALWLDLPNLRMPGWPAFTAAAYVVVFGVVFGYFAWFRVVAALPATTASLATLPVPVLGVFIAAAWLGEPIGWRETLALLLIVGALGTLAAPIRTNRARKAEVRL